jgi:AcrR family transcriptional regulator
MEAGREAFGRQAYEDVSLSAVAEEAGVAHGLPFHYFGSKRGLYVEVVRSVADELRIVHAVPPDLAPAEAMRQVLHQHIRYMEKHQHLLLGPMGRFGLDEQVHEVFDEARWAGAMYALSLVGIDEASPETRLVMNGWLAYMDNVLARWLTDRGVDRTLIVEAFVQVLLATLESVRDYEPDLDLRRMRV